METAVKNEYTSNVGEVGYGETIKNSQVLRNHQLALQNELKDAMSEGLIEEVVRIQAMLGSLPIRIKTAEVAEIKSSIASGNKRLAEIKEDFLEATRIRNEKHRIYVAKLKITEDAGTDVLKVDFILTTLDNEAESIRSARREYNEKLNNLITSADA